MALATRKMPARRRGRPLVIDFHSHIQLPEIGAFAAANGKDDSSNPQARMLDPQIRLKDMDRMGVDIQVISLSHVQFCYWAEPKKGLELAKMANNRLAEMTAVDPDRMVGIGTVPMQDVGRATRELERAVTKLGLKGLMIGCHAENTDLGDRKLWRFWRKVQELDVPIFIHPTWIEFHRFSKHYLWNSLGQPVEEGLAMASIIYEGLLNEFPKLKICIAHAGGILPFYSGRADRNFVKWPGARVNLKKNPSWYIKKFYFDTCCYDHHMVEFLINKVGDSQVLMGADYPVGEDDPVAFVKKMKISRASRDKILGGNAAKLLKLRV